MTNSLAAIVNLDGSRLRQIAPDAIIIACGQKRSNDMAWSEIIDLAGNNFDVHDPHSGASIEFVASGSAARVDAVATGRLRLVVRQALVNVVGDCSARSRRSC